VLTGRKYRLDLTDVQAEACTEYGNICRDVWNTGLEQRRIYRRRGEYINYEQQAAELADAKREFPWLAEAPSHVLQQTLRDLDRACREHGTWNVNWRSKARWAPSLRFPAGNLIAVERLGKKWGRAKLPKLGSVRFRWSRPLGGVVRSATVSYKAGHWYVSFLVEDGEIPREAHALPHTAVGVDRGVVVAAATSDGDLLDRDFVTAAEAERHRRLQQRLERQKKGSKRRRDTIAKLGKISARQAGRRGDFCAQTANDLTARYGLVVLEDLKIGNMTRSAKGTPAEPGRNVAQKSGLNRAILAKGWGRLELALQSKARYSGTVIVKVNPAFTSQTCHRCKGVSRDSRESQAVFRCRACGHTDHADVNAAKNILAAGLAVTGRGDLRDTWSMKRQPTSRLMADTGIPAL
jgi:putative transposase